MVKVYYTRLTDWADKSDDFFYPKVDESTARIVRNFRNPGARRTKLLGESMVRSLLHTEWGLAKDSYRLLRGEHGKPFIVDSAIPVFFNLSHSGDYIVCAISDSEVGIDIEKVTTARMNVARRFFHPAELWELETATAEHLDDLFFTYWAVKESYLKYIGTGLSSPLSSFQVVAGDQRIRISGENDFAGVHIHPCHIDRDYKCFVCSAGDEMPGLFHWKD